MRNTKGVCGKGYKDRETKVNTEGGKLDPAYRAWSNMLNRCYGDKERYLGYIDVEVCKEWLQYENFKDWFYSNDWESKDLDKDIIGNGKLYSPETCCFVTRKVNNFIMKSTKGLPFGSYQGARKLPYVAMVRNPLTGIREELGSFENSEAAHKVWLKRKGEIAQDLAETVEDKRVAKALRDKFTQKT